MDWQMVLGFNLYFMHLAGVFVHMVLVIIQCAGEIFHHARAFVHLAGVFMQKEV